MSEPEVRPDAAPERPPLTHRIDRVSVQIHVGVHRGPLKVSEITSAQPLALFPKDDGLSQPWGRALEELLEQFLLRVASGETP